MGTNFSEILFMIQTFSLKKMHLKVSSDKWRPFCFCLNVLINLDIATTSPRCQWVNHGTHTLKQVLMTFSSCIHWNSSPSLPHNSVLPINSFAPGKYQMNVTRPYGIKPLPEPMLTCHHWWQVNIGSGIGLVPLGNKPLPEPLLTQISCRHTTSLEHNELKVQLFTQRGREGD